MPVDYAINPSHAAYYALAAWQLTFLKAQYPDAYEAAIRNLQNADQD